VLLSRLLVSRSYVFQQPFVDRGFIEAPTPEIGCVLSNRGCMRPSRARHINLEAGFAKLHNVNHHEGTLQ